MASQKSNVAELVQQLPKTDKEIELEQKAAEAAKSQDPNQPEQKPAPPPPTDGPAPASKFTAPHPAEAAKLCDAILAGGSESMIELISLVRDPAADDFRNYKPEYMLHCLTVYLGAGKEKQRAQWGEALASQLGNAKLSLHVRGLLARELQWIGGEQAVAALGKALADEELCQYAAAALVAIGGGADALRASLPQSKGRPKLILIQNLGVLRDEKSVDALQGALKDEDREVRLTAGWALAKIAQPRSIEALLKAADIEPGFERIKATKNCLVLAESLAASGKHTDAARVYRHLRDTRTDEKEQHIREAAVNGLQQAASSINI